MTDPSMPSARNTTSMYENGDACPSAFRAHAIAIRTQITADRHTSNRMR